MGKVNLKKKNGHEHKWGTICRGNQELGRRKERIRERI
jgi:hypothetical protein